MAKAKETTKKAQKSASKSKTAASKPTKTAKNMLKKGTLKQMAKYKEIKSEHQLRSLVFDDYFRTSGTSWEPEINNIDFVVTDNKSKGKNYSGAKRHYVWMENKMKVTEQYTMLTQLLLTIKKTYDKNEFIVPNYVGCFDIEKIIFVPMNLLLELLHDNDIKWNITASDTKDSYFLKILSKLQYYLFNNDDVKIFTFGKNDKELKDFIKTNIYSGIVENKFEITEHNFDRIYLKWVEKVKPSIAINWEDEKKNGLFDGDFFLADLLSKDDLSIKDKLLIGLQLDHYKLTDLIKKTKILIDDDIYYFKDKQKAHKEFWSIYKRPPLAKYWENIIGRKALLVPQDIREIEGSFFTPQIWVELSQDYIAQTFGENWQEEYYVWDCCAGTGNLLVGINKKIENVFASTLLPSDIKLLHDRIDNGALLLKKNVFQFDFLNDNFDNKKVPKSLRDIINDPEKRKKLIIYINPPYAEGGNSKQMRGTANYKKDVQITETQKKYKQILKDASRELYQQFLIRIKFELSNCKIANFSKLKIIQGASTDELRNHFNIKLKKLFIIPADTFFNVGGNFPVGFFIWDSEKKEKFKKIKADVYDKDSIFIDTKNIVNYSSDEYISKWVNTFKTNSGLYLGWLHKCTHNDIQNANMLCIVNEKTQMNIPRGIEIYDNNIFYCGIRYAISKVIKQTWLNDRDQYLFPNNNYKNDKEFILNCFAYMIFHDSNNIQSEFGTNNWIPFSDIELNAKGKFESNFLYNLINGKHKIKKEKELFDDDSLDIEGKLTFSREAKNVFNAGKNVWKYYHSKSRVKLNASLYDIKGYFQGFSNNKMNNKSDDEEYNVLINKLRSELKILSEKIEPKVYEYGFLL